MAHDESFEEVTFDSAVSHECDEDNFQGFEKKETGVTHNFDGAVMNWLDDSFCSKCMRHATFPTESQCSTTTRNLFNPSTIVLP
jgi:hypothetical protein